MSRPFSGLVSAASRRLRRLAGPVLVAFLCLVSLASATPYGTVYLLPRHPVYEFLVRLTAKGFLPHTALSTRPWTRLQVADALVGVAIAVGSGDRRLTRTDRAQWWFYIGEFADEIVALGADKLLDDVDPAWRDRAAWWTHASGDDGGWFKRFSLYRRDDAELRLWVAGGLTTRYDTSATYRRHAEIGGWLRLGKHWGMQAAMRDVAVSGKYATIPQPFSRERGIGYIDNNTLDSTFYYDDAEAIVTYGSRFFTASVGTYPLVFGPGRHANVILSDKAPPLPQVKLTIHPWKWLTFTYVHMSLQSGVPESGGLWKHYAPENTGYAKKFYAAHRLEFTALRGVDIGLGESIVYGGRGPVLRYLIPVVPFRAAQHDEGDLDNLQMWGDIAIARLPRTRLYGALFIDELAVNELFKKDNIHNWSAWQVGAQVADLWGLAPDVDLGVEYTHAAPWVYRHKYPWNTYDTWAYRGNDAIAAYPLGFWQGHNGDFVQTDLVWRPRRTIKLALSASQARRGGDGTPGQQYDPPAEPFLFGPVTRTRELRGEAAWEPIRDLVMRGGIGYVERRQTGDTGSTRRRWTEVSLGVTYNVW